MIRISLRKRCLTGLLDVLGEESATHADLMAVGQQFFAALYGQSKGTS